MSYFIISAPSGCGKTTVIRHLMESFSNIRQSISVTTRPKRAEEKESLDYYFKSKQDFLNHIKEGELLEYTKIFDHYYGTLRSELKRLEQFHIIFDVDIHGMRRLKEALPQATSIFITPPSIDELKRRLCVRGQDSHESIAQRLSHAKNDLAYQDEYDYVILNDQLPLALKEVQAIMCV